MELRSTREMALLGGLCRLVAQAQTIELQHAVLGAYWALPERHRDVLATELARTGRAGEAYSSTPALVDQGPAFLIYYGPAFLRFAAKESAGARAWPPTERHRRPGLGHSRETRVCAGDAQS